jgi:hypothetical protein
MPLHFSFKSAKFVDESGQTFALSSAQAKFRAGARPVRLQLEVANPSSEQDTTVATLELSRVLSNTR